MNKIFQITPPFHVPDGTLVSPFLNAKDSMSDLPHDLLDGFSLAAGIIEPEASSKIHLMPFVTQVTFVLTGDLTVHMKEPTEKAPYELQLSARQAVLTKPGTYFQLVNKRLHACEVLYIVSPAYVFDVGPGHEVLYDDALVLEETWSELSIQQWQPRQLMPSALKRKAALQRIHQKKQKVTIPNANYSFEQGGF